MRNIIFGTVLVSMLCVNSAYTMKELQDTLYFDPIDQERLGRQIENLQSTWSKEDLDHEYLMAMSLNYERIPVLIPFLSNKNIDWKDLPHVDPKFLVLLAKNNIVIKGSQQLGLKKDGEMYYIEKIGNDGGQVIAELAGGGKETLYEDSGYSIEAGGMNCFHGPRKKSRIETVIEEDDVESLRLLSNQPNFDYDQKIEKVNLQYGYTEIPIILYCIEKNAIKCFKYLLINGSNPLATLTLIKDDDSRQLDGMTIAAENGNLNVMELIEEKGGRISKDVIAGAAKFHKNYVLRYFIRRGMSPQDLEYALAEAARFDNFEGVNLFLENGVNFNAKYQDEEILHYAARSGQVKMAEFLISAGADIEAKDEDGKTPLLVTMYVDMAELLISKGANIEAKDNEGMTSLHETAWEDEVELAELLISKGANIEAKDDEGKTPLFFALYFDMAELLISKGANIEAKDNDGMTPLHKAVANDRVDVAELLISAGANVNARDNWGQTPLHYAVGDYKEVFSLLIARGADETIKNNDGEVPVLTYNGSYSIEDFFEKEDMEEEDMLEEEKDEANSQ